ncbi:hypothetical protein CCH79_00018828, partial [Gambusia affinis]
MAIIATFGGKTEKLRNVRAASLPGSRSISTKVQSVGFSDCTDRTRFLFTTDDSRFVVQTDGVITGLDFERVSKHTLLVTVENEAPFAVPLVTSTATVVVTVVDVNEPPIFDSEEKQVSKREDLAKNSIVAQYTASDPDTGRKQKVMYKVIKDPGGWLNVDKETGVITVKTQMDRESPLVTEEKYTALIGAYDDDQNPATGTGTLIIKLDDVNDNPPTIVEREFEMCNKKPIPYVLSVTDKDGTGFTFPYGVNIRDSSKAKWTVEMNDTGMYEIISDPAGWFDIDKETGEVKVRNRMDRESPLVKEEKYTALIGASDDDRIAATATGTLVLHLQDVNDNPPTIEERKFTVCSKIAVPQLLTVTDRDGPGFTSPYNVSLVGTGIILTLNRELEIGDYTVAMSIADNQGLSQVSTVTARVCDCTGEDVSCREKDVGGSNPPVILGILKATVVLLT